MICLTILLVILGVLFIIACLGATILLDPIICILLIIGIVALIKKIFSKKKSLSKDGFGYNIQTLLFFAHKTPSVMKDKEVEKYESN